MAPRSSRSCSTRGSNEFTASANAPRPSGSESLASAPFSSRSFTTGKDPEFATAISSAVRPSPERRFGSAPRSSRSFVFATSSTAYISAVPPASFLAFTMAPRSSKQPDSFRHCRRAPRTSAASTHPAPSH